MLAGAEPACRLVLERAFERVAAKDAVWRETAELVADRLEDFAGEMDRGAQFPVSRKVVGDAAAVGQLRTG